MATSVMFIWSIFQAMGLVWGAIPTFLCLVGWFWPTRGKERLAAGAPAASPCGRACRERRDAGARRARRQRAPDHAFGHRSVMWWATMCMVAIEATAFALAIASYLYLKGRVPHWPPGAPTPGMFWGTVNVVILVGVGLAQPAGEEGGGAVRPVRCSPVDGDRARLRPRFQHRPHSSNFGNCNVRWDTNAYGSVTWFLLGLHTTHVLTDLLDSTVLAAVMFCGRVDDEPLRRRVGERHVLELRRGVVAADLCRHLPCATIV